MERATGVTGDFGATGTYFYNIARLDRLRIEIDVPQSFALKVKPDTPASVTFAEVPERTFDAKVVRTSQAIDQTSGTMRAELVMDNRASCCGRTHGAGRPRHRTGCPCVLVPAMCSWFGRGCNLPPSSIKTTEISFRPVRIGRDLGTEAEVCSGLALDDRVILSPNALLKAGDKVLIAKPSTARVKALLPDLDLQRVAVGAEGVFVADEADLAAQPVRLQAIQPASNGELMEAVLADRNGGPVAAVEVMRGCKLAMDGSK